MNRDDDEEATAKAFAAIEQTLQGFTSPSTTGDTLFGKQPTTNPYTMGSMEWMQSQLTHNPEDHSMLPARTPKRTPMMERAGTPVMSNSSKNLVGLEKQLQKQPSTLKTPGSASGRSTYSMNDTDDIDDDDEDMGYDQPAPVKTPLQRKFKTSSLSPSSTTKPLTGTSPATTSITTTTSTTLKQSVFRRHHDALWEYLSAKRNLHKRLDLERQEQQLDQAMMDTSTPYDTTNTNTISEDLSHQECQMEVDFCASLCDIGHALSSSSSSSMLEDGPLQEGHFWDLLAKLRKLGRSALVWDDDHTSTTQNMSAQSFFLQQLASQKNATPKDLVQAMSSSSSTNSKSLPLVMKRKQQLLKWIQHCLELESKDTKAKLMGGANQKFLSPTHPDDPNLPSLISEMDANGLKTIANVCLALFLEGKNDEALELVRSRGQFHKAAMWKGGEPYGYSTKLEETTQTLEEVTVGNPNRFLWKRQVWKAGRKLLLQHSSQQQNLFGPPSPPLSSTSTVLQDAAIYSILSDDVQNALENPCIRSSWTRSLAVLLMGVQGRTQDEVLNKHHSYKRRSGTCFAGNEYEPQENEQLLHTAQLGTMTEAKMAAKLRESLFLKQTDDAKIDYRQAIMAFVVGKSAILEYCATETSRMHAEIEKARAKSEAGDDTDDDYIRQDWEGVRFLTHLTLFLDSLKDSSTPTVLDEMDDQKNAMLFQYVQYLESRPDLWHMIALYVCFLPEQIQLTYFPTVLARVLDDKERNNMMAQIEKLMPELELPLLRRVVRLSLSAPGLDDENVDAIKCNSLQWLLHKDDHLEDALICANILLREFFLDEEDKTAVAMNFLNEYLPKDLIDLVTIHITNREESGMAEDASEERAAKVNNALTEHLAYVGYLQAYRTFASWRETLQSTPTSSLENHKLYNYSNLNETEKAIADSNVLRGWMKEKKKHLELILEKAHDARGAWHTVLTHPGGWLSVDEDETASLDAEEQERRVNIGKIRSRHLVLATNLYHQVCDETAAWLSKSLHEAADLNIPREEVLHKLRSSNGNEHTPEYWYQHSLDLATLVASDKHGIYKAFPPSDLKELIAKLGETAVSKLMNV